MYFLWWDKPLDIEEPTVLSGNMVREMCALMCMRSFGTATDYLTGLPELLYGVRYGSKRWENIAETSVKPDEDCAKTKWYRLDKIVVYFVTEFYYNIVVHYGREPGRKPLQCCLLWTATGSVDERPEMFGQYTAYPVNLDCPGDAGGPKDQTTSPCLPSAPEVAAENGFYAQSIGTRNIQPLPLGPSITTNRIGIDGLCLTLGTWQQAFYVFIPRRPQPDYAPASVTLSHADVVRWRLCTRALQRYCPQPRWLRKSGALSHQDFPAYRSVYERSSDWPSSQDRGFTKEGSDERIAIWLGFSFAVLVYGGLHLLAWDAPFASNVEDISWRSSGILLASSGFICALFYLEFVFFDLLHERVVPISFSQDPKTCLGIWYKPLAGIMTLVGVVAGGFPIVAFACAYVAARGYLVVESFLQLVHLPDSAYALPKWPQYYPHIR